ncbi:hypothetical protein C8J56DRAFT_1061487 [Mycena floridula]|nr:hypothetical protein C8J56DRAFT_1061487 [Mycena floridula]
MSENASGGAASTRPPPAVSKDQLASSNIDKKRVDTFYESTYWISGGEQRPKGIWDPLYPKLQDCLLKRVVDKDGDVFLGLSASVNFPQPVYAQDPGLTESSSLVQGPANAQSILKVEVVTDIVHLHHLTKPFEKHQHRILRQDAMLMIREYQEKAIGRVTVRPGPNHMPHLMAELVHLTMMVLEAFHHQTHHRQSMRVNPDALCYATQHLTPSEAEAFTCLAVVQIHLHGIDALQDFREQLR